MGVVRCFRMWAGCSCHGVEPVRNAGEDRPAKCHDMGLTSTTSGK